MKQFVFPMEKILELRRFEKEQAEAELGKANAEVARIQRALDAVASQSLSVKEQYDSTTDFDVHIHAQGYFIFLDQKKEQFLQELTQAQMVSDQKRESVRLAMQKVGALEKLREKKYAQWKREAEKADEEEAGDLVNARFAKG